MEKKIFTLIIAGLLGVATVNAQMSFSKRKAPETVRKPVKDPHWKYSDYKPVANKKVLREQQSLLKDINKGTYRTKNATAKEKRKIKESKVQKNRLERVKNQRSSNLSRETKITRRNADKKYAERESTRLDRVSRNKTDFSTRKMRKKTRTQKGFDLPPFSKRIRLRS